jgi:hypothetical protein
VTELLVVGAIVLLFTGAYVIRRQAQEIDALRVRAETAESWAERWQQVAEAAAEEAEQMATKHTQLQQLYALRTRELLAANWPIVIEYRKWAKR